jgi:hypothetical protein
MTGELGVPSHASNPIRGVLEFVAHRDLGGPAMMQARAGPPPNGWELQIKDATKTTVYLVQ